MHAGCVCENEGLRAALREDLDRYIFGGKFGRLTSLSVVLQSQGLWATAAYRLKHYVRHRLHSRLLGVLLLAVQRIVVALTGIDIDPHAHIGPGLLIPHGGYIVIGSVQIGRNCNIHQGVTLGERVSTLEHRTSKPPLPTLGDRVWVGPGAVVAGDVAIGDDASVGANSLVVRDVPPRGWSSGCLLAWYQGVAASPRSGTGKWTTTTSVRLRWQRTRKLAPCRRNSHGLRSGPPPCRTSLREVSRQGRWRSCGYGWLCCPCPAL